MNLIEELKWRGMLHNIIPGTEEQLQKESTVGYVGFDPTADSLHVGSLVPIILLLHLQRAGHKPIALMGGATGMIGDPSGKSDERNLLDENALNKNIEGIKTVLERFFDFESNQPNAPVLLNNYDWMKTFSFIDFARDVGKRITVNYMMAKDSVKKRINVEEGGNGMSFTEFTYQLIQGYDFYHLNKNFNCKLQMGGSDQWGNITTGSELIRRMNPDSEEKAFAFTCPLITKADGGKFGKSEKGNIWLTEDKTSVYDFYQFWYRQNDQDAEKYIKIYTFLSKEEIDSIINEHRKQPENQYLQKRLAEEITIFVHSKEQLDNAIKASKILFGKSTTEDLLELNESSFLSIFKGVPMANVTKTEIDSGIPIVEALSTVSGFLKSKSEVRRALKENSVSINKKKIGEDFIISSKDLLSDKYVLMQRGKKNYFILVVE